MNYGKTYRMRGYAMVPIDITIPLDEGQDPDDVQIILMTVIMRNSF